jgi:GNAT superfamily N-acetyltransferase
MLKYAVENLRDFGLRGFHLRLSAALNVYRELGFYVCTAPQPRDARIALDFSVMRLDELEEYCSLRPNWDKSHAQERLRRGGKCILARHGGAIAGFGWAMENGDWSEFLSRDIPPHPDEVYIADTYTQPAFRAKGVSTALIARCCRTYFDAGKRRAVASILPYNIASIRSFQKAGFQLAWRSGYVGLGKRRQPFDRPVR